MELKFKELLRILSTFAYFKGHPIQKKVFGNSDSWKIGKLVLTDGWAGIDGMGWSVNFFFSAHILKTTS